MDHRHAGGDEHGRDIPLGGGREEVIEPRPLGRTDDSAGLVVPLAAQVEHERPRVGIPGLEGVGRDAVHGAVRVAQPLVLAKRGLGRPVQPAVELGLAQQRPPAVEDVVVVPHQVRGQGLGELPKPTLVEVAAVQVSIGLGQVVVGESFVGRQCLAHADA
jgi:hypothetical protein